MQKVSIEYEVIMFETSQKELKRDLENGDMDTYGI